MFTPGPDGYGDGWGIDLDDPDAPRILHSGGISGFVSRIVRVPARGRCVVVLSNLGEEPWSPTVRSYGSPVRAIASGIEAILEENEPEPPARSTELSLAHVILEGGVEAGLSQFEDLPSSKKDAGLELRINSVGYSLLGRGRVDDALRVFTFNTRAYAESANTWDSLGAGYAEAEDRERAIENYRKALTLDPESETAKAMLLKLGDQPLPGKE